MSPFQVFGILLTALSLLAIIVYALRWLWVAMLAVALFVHAISVASF